jgi:hypothetical protein
MKACGKCSLWVWTFNHWTKASFYAQQQVRYFPEFDNLTQQLWWGCLGDGFISPSLACKRCQLLKELIPVVFICCKCLCWPGGLPRQWCDNKFCFY